MNKLVSVSGGAGGGAEKRGFAPVDNLLTGGERAGHNRCTEEKTQKRQKSESFGAEGKKKTVCFERTESGMGSLFLII